MQVYNCVYIILYIYIYVKHNLMYVVFYFVLECSKSVINHETPIATMMEAYPGSEPGTSHTQNKNHSAFVFHFPRSWTWLATFSKISRVLDSYSKQCYKLTAIYVFIDEAMCVWNNFDCLTHIFTWQAQWEYISSL